MIPTIESTNDMQDRKHTCSQIKGGGNGAKDECIDALKG